MKEISPTELKKWKDAGADFQLIDVREPYEAERCNIGGKLIPLGEVVDRMNEIRKDIPVVVHCKSGSRSSAMIQALSTRYGYDNLINLTGGILGYGAAVAPELNCD